MADLSVKIGKLKLKNPVMVASGTFGYAEEFKPFMDLSSLGAVVSKTITLEPRKGNPPQRTCETPAGMLNAIGLENPGLHVFLKEKLPLLKQTKVPVIVSIASQGDPDEFVKLAKELNGFSDVAALELNISCPNIREKRQLISQDPGLTFNLVKNVSEVTSKTLITKLSPNVTSIVEIAKAAEAAGSDAVSLINTLAGMSIDIEARKPKLAAVTGGLSGPAIRPVAVRMCWECSRNINIPIIGMGGIMDAQSALEFIIAGASAVSVGTANFINPRSCAEIIEGISSYLQKNKIKSIANLTGSLQT